MQLPLCQRGGKFPDAFLQIHSPREQQGSCVQLLQRKKMGWSGIGQVIGLWRSAPQYPCRKKGNCVQFVLFQA